MLAIIHGKMLWRRHISSYSVIERLNQVGRDKSATLKHISKVIIAIPTIPIDMRAPLHLLLDVIRNTKTAHIIYVTEISEMSMISSFLGSKPLISSTPNRLYRSRFSSSINTFNYSIVWSKIAITRFFFEYKIYRARSTSYATLNLWNKLESIALSAALSGWYNFDSLLNDRRNSKVVPCLLHSKKE